MNNLQQMDRELIYTTLFNYLKDNLSDDIKLFSRRLRHFNDVGEADTPALFLTQNNEISEAITNMPTKWTFTPEIYLYVNIGNDNDLSPYTILNPILDKIQFLFDIKMNTNYNMDGLINHVKIAGTIENDGGTLGQIAVAIIPLQISVVV